MTKSNSSATLSTSNLYKHPWYTQLKLLDNTMTCESPLQPKLKSAVTGQKSTKVCHYCQEEKSLDEFHAHPNSKDRKDHRCKTCTTYYRRLERLATKSAPPRPETCQCCNKSATLVPDHYRGTDQFRGWLCQACNTGIGRLGDNVEGLTQALNYLTNGN